MKCPKCRHILDGEYAYCPYCGEKLEEDTSFSPDDYGARFVQKADGSVSTDEAGGNHINTKKNGGKSGDKKVMKTSNFVTITIITAVIAILGAIFSSLFMMEIYVLAVGINMITKAKYDKKQLIAGIIFTVVAVICGIYSGFQFFNYFIN